MGVVSETPLAIGRDITNSIRIVDPYVSRRHCDVVLVSGHPVIRNLSMRNPTLVNNEPCAERELQPGDQISFASATLVVTLEAADAAGSEHLAD